MSHLTSSISFLKQGQQKPLPCNTRHVGSAPYASYCWNEGSSACNRLLQPPQPLCHLSPSFTPIPSQLRCCSLPCSPRLVSITHCLFPIISLLEALLGPEFLDHPTHTLLGRPRSVQRKRERRGRGSMVTAGEDWTP